jgi:hypothetical protein
MTRREYEGDEMDTDFTNDLEVFCPHCREAMALILSRHINAKVISVIPLSGRTIKNATEL